mmetsp:Transcript_2650/g.4723  ORF Transcript_2650/g.4723 Transcript_2650/m.4723 type:complete len:204 (-) Transcript_2650:12-623(-)
MADGDSDGDDHAGGSGSGAGGHSTVEVVAGTFGVQATPTSLTNYYALCPTEAKPLALLRFLAEHKTEKVMVFFLTCADVDFWERALTSLDHAAVNQVAVGTVAADGTEAGAAAAANKRRSVDSSAASNIDVKTCEEADGSLKEEATPTPPSSSDKTKKQRQREKKRLQKQQQKSGGGASGSSGSGSGGGREGGSAWSWNNCRG